MRHHTLLPLLAITAALPAQWAQITPTTSPSMRRAGAMAFDATANRLVMYGGVSPSPSTILGEVWSYNGQWTQLMPATTTTRWGHQMVRNPLNNRILSFGGRSPTISGLANDTYEWTGSSWQNVPTPNAPSPRFLYGMVHDSARSVFVLFGGRTALGANDETWEFDGVNWTQRQTATAPQAREEMAMFFDTTLNRTVLFGGYNDDTDTIYGDTWFYDGTDWTDVTPQQSPSPRLRTATVFDSVRKRAVMFGGFDGTDILTETYQFTGDEWLLVAGGATIPTNATEAYAGYDPVRQKFVLFGGYGGTFSNATWEFTGTSTGVFGTFGEGCETSAGVPTLSGTTPRIGQTLTLTFGNIPANAEGVILALGFSNLAWNGIPLPFDLGLIGLPGCNLLVAADVLDLAIAAAGTATYGVAIPNQTALLNSSLYVQGFVSDLFPGFALLGATNGGRALIGN